MDRTQCFHRSGSRVLLTTAILLAGACATRPAAQGNPGDVDMGMFIPVGAPVLEAAEQQKVLAPAEFETPLPAFPPGLDDDVRATICAEIVVTAEGEVASVRQLATEPECEPEGSATSRHLFPTVAATLRQWQFLAGGICRFEHDEAECDARGARIDRRAMKLAYFFRFVREGGTATVSRP